MPRPRTPSTLWCALAALVVAGPAGHAAPLILKDGTLDPVGYEHVHVDAAGTSPGTATITHHATAGNPDAWLGVLIAPSGSQIAAVFLRKGVVHDPGAPGGALASITHEEDAVCAPYDPEPRPCQATGPALRQDGDVFIASFNPEFVTTSWPLPIWKRFARTFSADDFAWIAHCDGAECSATAPRVRSHPDFSAAGPPIELGFFRAKSGGIVTEAGIDNWVVRANPHCTTPAACDDGDECTTDACDAMACRSTPIEGCDLPALTISVSDDGQPWGSGPYVPYSITVTNNADTPRSGLTVTDAVPAKTTFEPPPASDPGWSCTAPTAGGLCTTSLPDLAPGASATVRFAVRVEAGTPRSWDVVNVATTNPSAVRCTGGLDVSCGCSTLGDCHACPARCAGCDGCDAPTPCAAACILDGDGKKVTPRECGHCEQRCGQCTADCHALCGGCLLDCSYSMAESPENLIECCYAKFAVCLQGLCPSYQDDLCHDANAGILGRAAIAGAAGASGHASIDLYRVRDAVFAGTPGGRRATALYYRHSPDLLRVTFRNPMLLVRAQRAFAAWYGHLRTLADDAVHATHDADGATITPEQVATLTEFLEALQAVPGTVLGGPIERGRERLRVETWAGLTLTAALARLDGLICTVEPTYESIGCRVGDAMDVVEREVPASGFAGRLLVTLARVRTLVAGASDAIVAADRRTARRLGKRAARLVTTAARQVRARRGRRAIADAGLRGRAVEMLAPFPGELKALGRSARDGDG